MSGEGRPAGGLVDAAGLRLAIAATRWHEEITGALLDRALAAAAACGVDGPTVVRVIAQDEHGTTIGRNFLEIDEKQQQRLAIDTAAGTRVVRN